MVLSVVLGLLVLGALAGGPAAAAAEASGDGRGLWVVRDSLSSPEAIDAFLHMADDLGINMLFVQVNGRAEAYYRSALVPSPPGIPDGFDPLQYVIDGARKRGIEVHAWVNAFTASMLSTRPASPHHVLYRHPDWVLYHRSGRSLLDFGADVMNLNVPAIMLDPGVPEVRDYVVAVVEELVREYDVDGIHLDYVRYPSPDYGYHPRARAAFEELVGVDPLWLADPERVRMLDDAWGEGVVRRVEEAWREWRRRQVSDVVRRIYRTVESVKPWVKVSAAVFPDPDQAREKVLQDWAAWLREGIVDAVVPMTYTPDPEGVGGQLRRAVGIARDAGRHVYGGIGVYRLGGRPDALRAIIERARGAGVDGVVLFSYTSLRSDPETVAVLRRDIFGGRSAPLPGMPWKAAREAS